MPNLKEHDIYDRYLIFKFNNKNYFNLKNY